MIRGQCLCGEVKYSYNAPIVETIICHCLDCQKAQGSLFAFNSPIDQQKFVIEQGKLALKEFFYTENKARVFCLHCGSPLYSYRKDLPHVIRLRLGTVTEGSIPTPKQAFFVQHCPDFLFIQLCQE
ncbi:GFA family protein [Acinetobacter puyangensis]|uniref:GFA family protein n=1 Tax=Acinetobacter puyangensis TaxID=1096779 RepID=UPI003A4E62E7